MPGRLSIFLSPGGSETAAILLKALLEDGFNSLRRDKMLEALYAGPTLAPYTGS